MNLSHKLNFIVSKYKEADGPRIILKMIQDGALDKRQGKKCLQLYISHCQKKMYCSKISSEYILLVNLLFNIIKNDSRFNSFDTDPTNYV